jgi:hypothetical protein
MVMDFARVNVFRIQKSNHQSISQSKGLVTNMAFYMHCDTATNSANTGDMAEGMMTGFDLENSPVSDLLRQGAQIVLTLKNDPCTYYTLCIL